MEGTPPFIKQKPGDRGSRYEVGGSWTVEYSQACLKASLSLMVPSHTPITLCGDGLKQFDVTGIWLLFRRLNELKLAGADIEMEGFPAGYAALLQGEGVLIPKAPHEKDIINLQEIPKLVGQKIRQACERAADILAFLGQCWVLIWGAVLHPTRFRFRAFIKQCEVTAVQALPIVGLISLLIAIVISYQGSMQLKRFGAEIYTIDLVAISVLREMAVLLTAVMIAGRSGSAFAAEIGTMKFNEETDALVTIGIDPMKLLILPRLVALTLMMPLLTFFADMMGLLGGGVLSIMTKGTSLAFFFSRLSDAIRMNDFWIGLGKAPVFGFIIAVVGCYHGMKVRNSTESVGKETTQAVVDSIFLVILSDALFSLLFTALDI
ncbi:MAG: MlaE family ABC transporter permease [Bdellovibrionales bacterium]